MVATLLAANGRFIVTAAGGDDEHVKLWSLSGECLCTHANKQGEIFSAALSVDSRFVALGCWMSDDKVLKVTTAKDGGATGLETAMTCTGQRRRAPPSLGRLHAARRAQRTATGRCGASTSATSTRRTRGCAAARRRRRAL